MPTEKIIISLCALGEQKLQWLQRETWWGESEFKCNNNTHTKRDSLQGWSHRTHLFIIFRRESFLWSWRQPVNTAQIVYKASIFASFSDWTKKNTFANIHQRLNMFNVACKNIFFSNRNRMLVMMVTGKKTMQCFYMPLGIPSTNHFFSLSPNKCRDTESQMKAQLINYMRRILSFYNFTHALNSSYFC